MRNVEILAPAGSYESLLGAVHAGCDGVYLGGRNFGARAFANNLEKDEMLRAMDYVHLRDKKIYLTVNTLLKQKELENQLYEYLLPYYENGLDAVIVQDIGVMAFINEHFSKLPIHASTQMTLTTENGIRFMKDMGVTRFVTSRELQLEEVKEIRKQTDLEIETFVHGALCYCYSGQCLFSSVIGGRSGNRGKCAQPCRMPYRLYQDGQLVSSKEEPYLLSPKDMNTLSMIPDLIEAGIDSFKIEGRMKRAEYAAFTASVYRKYVDYYQQLGRKEYDKYLIDHREEYEYDLKCLMDLYNRGGFSTGYFHRKNGKSMMTMGRPNHSGVFIGSVIQVKGNRAIFQIGEDIYAQDVLEFRDNHGNALYDYTVKDNIKKEEKIVESNFKFGTGIKAGDFVYRTKRSQLLKEISKKYIETPLKKGVNGYFKARPNEPMELLLTYEGMTSIVKGNIVEEAKSQPLSKEKVEKQLKKDTNDSFFIETAEVEIQGNVFIPIGQLNELRRNALKQLEDKKIEPLQRKAGEYKEHKNIVLVAEEKPCLHVTITHMEQLETVVKNPFVHGIYLDIPIEDCSRMKQMIEIIVKNRKKAYYVLPYIVRREKYELYEKALKKENTMQEVIYHKSLSGFILRNYDLISLFDEYREHLLEKEIVLDANVYVFNQRAKQYWMKKKVTRTTAPLELNGEELLEMRLSGQEIIIYGHVPLMVSAQCFVKNLMGCKKEMIFCRLEDYKRKSYIAKNICTHCYNLIYDEIPISLHNYSQEIRMTKPDVVRMEFQNESKEQIEMLISQFGEIYFDYPGTKISAEWEYTLGHYKKGVK